MVVVRTKRDRGFFCVSQEELGGLLRCDVDWQEVGAKLVISRFSDCYSRFSSAGHSAIADRLGIGIDSAKKATRELRGIFKPSGELIIAPAGNVTFSGQPERVRYMWMHFRNDNEKLEDYIGIENALVGSRKSGTKNLSQLRRFRNTKLAARVYLLLLYSFSYKFNGCYKGALYFDSTINKKTSCNGYSLIKASLDSAPRFSDSFLKCAYMEGLESINKNRNSREKEVFNILVDLERKGLVERVVVLVSTDQAEQSYGLEYVLDTKVSGGKSFRLCGKIERTARAFGIGAAKGEDPIRFYNEYVAVVPQGLKAEIVMLYRPAYICWDPAISEAKDSLRGHKEKEQMVLTWLNEIARQG